MKDTKILQRRPIGEIDENDCHETVEILNQLLADEFGLFTKTLNFHWNITGPRFHSLHTFLEGQYRNTLEVMDKVAERVRFHGSTPISTLGKFSEETNLREKNGKSLSSNDMILELFEDHQKIQDEIKDAVANEDLFKRNPGTEDFLVGLLQKHEEVSWMLKSHLQ